MHNLKRNVTLPKVPYWTKQVQALVLLDQTSIHNMNLSSRLNKGHSLLH